ncbi:ubiquinol-cytochrome c reductase cytochrome b subunit [Nocardioides terrae]|uniref:Cytochrome bc1 complex cytochrome b subunit n=2 Tax=Nocardioides terrae TaxID=574651 RepID=A0A1I1LYW7_9ACTN|nr:ubiquinol-cytochrome c reductase cytochrome b subunit [Nocardioides terrae]
MATYGGLAMRAEPNHWSRLLGAVSASCLAVLVVTGVLLLVHYDPSSEVVTYSGTYLPLRRVPVSAAYASTVHLSLEVRGGMLLRQTHHWAALVLPASLMLQLATRFFTGAFRRPYRLAWVLLATTFVLALAGGWSGYDLPDDMLSGTGLRIFEGILVGTPFVGSRLTALVFGGEFPGDIVPRLFWLHVLVVPVLLAAVLVARYVVARRRRPPQLPGPGRRESNVVGPPWPAAAARRAGMFLVTAGVLVVMGGTLTVAPIWLYGPFSPESASAGSQPDWYTSWLDGALRLAPSSWDVSWLGGTLPLAVLVPELVAAVFLGVVVLYPLLEQWVTRDRGEHHVLDRPRNRPRRTGLGVAGFTFFGLLWLSGSTDIVATTFHVGFETQVLVLRVLLVAAPVLGYIVTVGLCRALQARDREAVEHGVPTGRMMRSAEGRYWEPHVPLRPEARGRIGAAAQEERASRQSSVIRPRSSRR